MQDESAKIKEVHNLEIENYKENEKIMQETIKKMSGELDEIKEQRNNLENERNSIQKNL